MSLQPPLCWSLVFGLVCGQHIASDPRPGALRIVYRSVALGAARPLRHPTDTGIQGVGHAAQLAVVAGRGPRANLGIHPPLCFVVRAPAHPGREEEGGVCPDTVAAVALAAAAPAESALEFAREEHTARRSRRGCSSTLQRTLDGLQGRNCARFRFAV
jgi:hypothetical protein